MTEHSEACEAARAGHFFMERDGLGQLRVPTDRPDPYPSMGDLAVELQADVLACPHHDHDVVRLFWRLTR